MTEAVVQKKKRNRKLFTLRIPVCKNHGSGFHFSFHERSRRSRCSPISTISIAIHPSQHLLCFTSPFLLLLSCGDLWKSSESGVTFLYVYLCTQMYSYTYPATAGAVYEGTLTFLGSAPLWARTVSGLILSYRLRTFMTRSSMPCRVSGGESQYCRHRCSAGQGTYKEKRKQQQQICFLYQLIPKTKKGLSEKTRMFSHILKSSRSGVHIHLDT